MSLAIKSNTAFWEIKRGVSQQKAIRKSDGWAMYDEIVMDFKSEKDINQFSMLRLTPGAGLTIDGIRLIISLTYQQTTALRGKVVFADIKMKIGSEVIDPIPFEITIKQTVSKIP